MRFSKIVWLMILLPLVFSCRKEPDVEQTEEIQMRVKLHRKNGSSETEVKTLRLMLFDLNSNDLRQIYNQDFVPADVYDANSQSYILNVKINRKQSMKLAVIANEKSYWNLGDTVNKVNHHDLISKYAKYDDPTGAYSLVEPPFVMFCDANLVVGAEEGPVVERQYELVRQAVKLTFNLRYLEGLNLDFKKLTVVNLPQYNALSASLNVCNSAFVAVHLPTQTIDLSAAGFTLKDGFQEMNDAVVLYLPEHLFDHTASATSLVKHTYIRLEAVKDGAPQVYDIPMGENVNKLYREDNPLSFDQLTGGDFCLQRNTHFIYNTSISRLGVSLDYEVKPWTQVDIDFPIETPYLNISSLSERVLYTGTIAALNSDTVRFNFWTNMLQKDIYLDSVVQDNLGQEHRLSDIFNSRIDYAAGVGQMPLSGSLKLKLKDEQNIYNSNIESFTISFWVGKLRRDLKISMVQFPKFTMQEVPWVGFFYAGHEQGERVLYSKHQGDWSVKVEYPSNNSDQFVQLSDQISSDVFLWTSSPADAENFPLTQGEQTLSGTGDIYFRVGLTSTIPSEAPRYAKLILTYSGGTKDLYLRQGDSADYLMRPTDPLSGGDRSPLCAKPMSKNPTIEKFTQLTSAWFEPRFVNQVFLKRVSASTLMYIWANGGNSNNLIYSVHPYLGQYAANSVMKEDITWKMQYYYDVSIMHKQVSINVMRASLLQDTSANPSVKNYQYGMIADGFSDRWKRETLNTTDIQGGAHALMLTTETNDMMRAYPGMLFYNSAADSYASVFFPMQGRREHPGFLLEHAGMVGYYLSSEKSTVNTNRARGLKFIYLNGECSIEVDDLVKGSHCYSLRSFAYSGTN